MAELIRSADLSDILIVCALALAPATLLACVLMHFIDGIGDNTPDTPGRVYHGYRVRSNSNDRSSYLSQDKENYGQ